MCYLCFDIALVFDGLRERRQVRWRFGDEMSDAFEVSWSRMGVDVHVHVHKSCVPVCWPKEAVWHQIEKRLQ